MEYHEITVPRTARFALSADPGDATTEIWFACHGYAQLAGSFLESIMPAAAPGRVLVAPEGLSRFYPDSGTGRVGASWMTKEGRESEIRDYVALLDAVRDEVTRGLPSPPASRSSASPRGRLRRSDGRCAGGHPRTALSSGEAAFPAITTR